jgi:hypothetical protein
MQEAQTATDTTDGQPDTSSTPEPGTRTQEQVRGTAKRAIGGLEHGLARGGDLLWRAFKRRPALGVSVATLLGLGLAATIGASELAIAFASGVAAYQMLKKNEPPSKALEDAAKFGL